MPFIWDFSFAMPIGLTECPLNDLNLLWGSSNVPLTPSSFSILQLITLYLALPVIQARQRVFSSCVQGRQDYLDRDPLQKRHFAALKASRRKPWPQACARSCRGRGQVRSSQAVSNQVRSGQVRSGQVKSRQVRSSQVAQVRSGQVRTSIVVSITTIISTTTTTTATITTSTII